MLAPKGPSNVPDTDPQEMELTFPGKQIDSLEKSTTFSTEKKIIEATKRGAKIFSVFLKDSGNYISKGNPYKIKKEIANVVKNKKSILEITKIKSGAIVVKTNSSETAIEVANIKYLNNVNITSEIGSESISNKFIIRGVDNALTTEEIWEDLISADICPLNIRRFSKKQGNISSPMPIILVHHLGLTFPPKISICYELLQTQQFFDNVRQCSNCWRPGHVSKFCRGKKVCVSCGIPHEFDPCIPSDPVKCANCGSNHRADDKECPTLKQEAEILKLKTIHHCSYMEAKNMSKGKAFQGVSYSQVASTFNMENETTFPVLNRIEKKLDILIDKLDKVISLRNLSEALPTSQSSTENKLSSLSKKIDKLIAFDENSAQHFPKRKKTKKKSDANWENIFSPNISVPDISWNTNFNKVPAISKVKSSTSANKIFPLLSDSMDSENQFQRFPSTGAVASQETVPSDISSLTSPCSKSVPNPGTLNSASKKMKKKGLQSAPA